MKATISSPSRTFLKKMPFYNAAKNIYNRRRYSSLWRRHQVVRFSHRSTPISLVIVDPTDLIQKIQATGTFYEVDELDDIAPYFKLGGVFVDIGANTGQHSIYFAKVLGASKVILFEPIQQTCQILRENIRLNDLEGVSDLSHLGIGLGDKPSRATFSVGLTNLGSATLHEQSNGAIETKTGDSVLNEARVDFIKIDTEGFEMRVLAGLKNTIRKHRPVIYIEVDLQNDTAFAQFMQDVDYRVAKRHKLYDPNENFLILPN